MPGIRNVAAIRALAVVCLLVIAAAPGRAQCNPIIGPNLGPVANDNDPGHTSQIAAPKTQLEQPTLPEAGFLSDTHYTSQFFGFSFDLPLTVHGHEIMMAVMPEKEHALLALQYEDRTHKGYMTVTANDPRPGFDINTPEKTEEQLREWARTGTAPGGPQQLYIPDFLLRSTHFYHQFRREGRNYAAQYWIGINNYLVRVVIRTNDPDFLHKAKEAMSAVQFYCRKDDGTLTTEDGKPVKLTGEPYSGPTVPTFLVNAALHDEPAKNIPRGKVTDGVYRNPDIGVQYELPRGWKETSTDRSDPPVDPTALREYQFLHACSQKLLEISPPTPAPAEELQPVIVLRALDPNCLSMHTATSLTDKHTTDAVAAALEEFGEFGEIGSDELRTISGHLFMIFHGTIANSARSEDLAQRLSQNLYATRYNKMLLIWSVMAPTAAALDQIPTGNVAFEGSQPIQLHSPSRLASAR